MSIRGAHHAIAYLVEALRYKPEGRRFESRLGEFFNLPNLSSHNMALALIHPLTEVPGIVLGGKRWPAHKADITAICEPIV
jgi:hypothetical protein